MYGMIAQKELIETLWNVNSSRLITYFLASFGINRNIVECKLT